MKNFKWPGPAYWIGWTLAGAYNFVRDYFDTPLGFLTVFNLAHFTLWALVGLAVLPLIRQVRLGRNWRPWVFHLVLGALVTQFVITGGHWICGRVLGIFTKLDFLQLMVFAFRNCFHLGLMHYWIFVGMVQGIDTLRLARAQELELVQQKASFMRAQLESLRIQLQPHFLFNTLNVIASLMHYDVRTADRMLNRLSELLRVSLRETGHSLVTLRQEIEIVSTYLEIEKIRFEERLQVVWSVQDDLQDLSVPTFLLQPLVENAIKHGVAPRAAGGRIEIRASLEEGALLLDVEDDGADAQANVSGFGIGLKNTRERLATLYGSGQHFELLRQDGRTIARVRIPLSFELARAA